MYPMLRKLNNFPGQNKNKAKRNDKKLNTKHAVIF